MLPFTFGKNLGLREGSLAQVTLQAWTVQSIWRPAVHSQGLVYPWQTSIQPFAAQDNKAVTREGQRALGHISSPGHASVSSTRMQILGTGWFVSPGSPQGYLHKGVGVGGSMDALTQPPPRIDGTLRIKRNV